MSHAEYAVMSERAKKFDPNATADDCIQDLRRLQDVNPHKAIVRNFYRVNGTFSDATWNQFFGTFLEFRRAAGLELTRNQHALERKIAKHASLDIYRKFYCDEVLPYHEKFDHSEGNSKRFKTILSGSDFHDEKVDPFVLSTFIDVAHRVQPDVIVLNGDVFDLYEFSRFSIDPRQVMIAERFSFVKTHIFGALRRWCPNSEITLVIGNHEWRLMKLLADKTPAMKVLLSDVMGLTLSDVFGLDEFEINLVAKLDLAAFNSPDMKSELRENYKVFYDTFVCSHFKDTGIGLSGTSGHTHRPHQDTFTNHVMGKCSWTQTGSMCETREEYVDGRDKCTNSFALFHIDTVKKAVAPEHFIIPSDHVVIHGKLYVRSEGSGLYTGTCLPTEPLVVSK
jgi:UDP-2,3-diacylglucosamine pyrophosphatase LpxH